MTRHAESYATINKLYSELCVPIGSGNTAESVVTALIGFKYFNHCDPCNRP